MHVYYNKVWGGKIKSNALKGVGACHRVVRSDGEVGGWNRGREKKQTLLKKEGAVR